MITRVGLLLFLIALVMVQVSFLTTWPAPVSGLNLMLGIVIFLTVIMNYEQALLWAFGAGLFLELYSGLPFGITSLSFLLTVMTVNFLFSNFFTNRSLYSLVFLGFFGTVAYNVFVLGLSLLATVFGLSTPLVEFNVWSTFFWQPLFNLLILAIIFATYSFSTGRLRTIFLTPMTSYETTRKH